MLHKLYRIENHKRFQAYLKEARSRLEKRKGDGERNGWKREGMTDRGKKARAGGKVPRISKVCLSNHT
jgi:hypothetical protein